MSLILFSYFLLFSPLGHMNGLKLLFSTSTKESLRARYCPKNRRLWSPTTFEECLWVYLWSLLVTKLEELIYSMPLASSPSYDVTYDASNTSLENQNSKESPSLSTSKTSPKEDELANSEFIFLQNLHLFLKHTMFCDDDDDAMSFKRAFNPIITCFIFMEKLMYLSYFSTDPASPPAEVAGNINVDPGTACKDVGMDVKFRENSVVDVKDDVLARLLLKTFGADFSLLKELLCKYRFHIWNTYTEIFVFSDFAVARASLSL